jgi:hypothetical protein
METTEGYPFQTVTQKVLQEPQTCYNSIPYPS